MEEKERVAFFSKGDSKFSRGYKNSSASENFGHAYVPKYLKEKV